MFYIVHYLANAMQFGTQCFAYNIISKLGEMHGFDVVYFFFMLHTVG